MDARTQQNPAGIPTPPTTPLNGVVDVEAILREVEALAQAAMQPSMSLVAPVNQDPETNSPYVAAQAVASQTAANDDARSELLDVASLERDIEALLRGSTGSTQREHNVDQAADTTISASSMLDASRTLDAAPSTPSHQVSSEVASSRPSALTSEVDVATSAIEVAPSDPMMREIAAILDDTNESVLRNADGSIDRALDTVFDARALAGQEEEVHRALIEAFGTSRRPVNDFESTQAIVTNPVPRFDGISRAVAPEVSLTSTNPSATSPRRFEEIAAQSIARENAPDYAGETPFEPAFPAVPMVDAAPETLPSNSKAASEQQPAPQAGSQTSVEGSRIAASLAAPTKIDESVHLSMVENPATGATTNIAASIVASSNPKQMWLAVIVTRASSALTMLATSPLRICALPMRLVPATWHSYITVAALSMLVCVPAAWWMAQRSTTTHGVGRIEFPVLQEPVATATSAASESAPDSAHSDAAPESSSAQSSH